MHLLNNTFPLILTLLSIPVYAVLTMENDSFVLSSVQKGRNVNKTVRTAISVALNVANAVERLKIVFI